MWDQKKANTQQVYQSLYGQSPSGQLPQPSLQQPFQSVAHYPYSMGPPTTQSMATGMAQGLGPPPPYTPYAESAQQQMKYMPQMGYNPNQYLPTSTGSVGAPPLMPQPQQSSMGAVGGGHHSYPSPYHTNPYTSPSLYPYGPYSNPGLTSNGTVVMPQGFDAGARFDGISRPNIPPPPPGVAPNAAQMAVMQGQSVVIGQKKGSFLEGGSSGGYTFW